MTKQLSLLTGHSEPVDLKAAMAPTSGKTVEVDLSVFDTVSSRDNNTFYVIGSTANGLQVSIRVWKEPCHEGETTLGIRVRIGDMLIDGNAVVAADSAFDAFKLPLNVWTGGKSGSGHRSILGGLTVPAHPWDTSAVLTEFDKHKVAADYYHTITELFPMLACMTPEMFESLFYQLTCIALQNVYQPKPKNTGTKVFLGGGAYPILDKLNGVARSTNKPFEAPKPTKPASVQSTPAKVATAKPVAAKPVPFEAPHPKDVAAAKKTASAADSKG